MGADVCIDFRVGASQRGNNNKTSGRKEKVDTARHHRVMYRSCPAPGKFPVQSTKLASDTKSEGERERHTHTLGHTRTLLHWPNDDILIAITTKLI